MTGRDINDELQQLHIRWTKFLERQTGKSLTQLAKLAGLSHTTLRRLQRPDYNGHLTPMTIERVKQYTKLPGPELFEFEDMEEPKGLVVPFGDLEKFTPDDRPHLAAAVDALLKADAARRAVIVDTRLLVRANVVKGDVLIIQPGQKPKQGDVVMAEVLEDGNYLQVLRVYRPGWLLAAAEDATAEVPLRIVESEVTVIGPAIALLR